MTELILTISIKDCEQQFFRSGGPGGQNQNKRETGVRIIHHPSGARGEARDNRSREQNRKAAFVRMVHSKEFKNWIELEVYKKPEIKKIENRVRTYNLAKNRVTDHRTGIIMYDVLKVLDGEFDVFYHNTSV